MSELFRQVFGCCLGRPRSKTETDPLLPVNELNPDELPPSDLAPPRIMRSDEETLAELIRQTESKMVNVQDPHPFLLRPTLPRPSGSHSQSYSRSRSPSPSGSHSLTPDGPLFDCSPSSAHPTSIPQDPILEVKLIKTCKGKAHKLHGRGRGRSRANARDDSPVAQDAGETGQEEAELHLSALTPLNEELLTSLSAEVQESLTEGFQLEYAGPVVQTWDDM